MDNSIVDPQVVAVILNWNRPVDTINCVNSLIAQHDVDIHIVVVDNASFDHSVEEIQKQFPSLQIVALPQNLGYSGGMNVGIQIALQLGAEYILLLNNDTVADPLMVKNLVREARAEVGITSPVIFHYDQPERPWSLGGMIAPLFLEQITPHHVGRMAIPKEPTIRSYFTGCALLVRQETFKRVGLFDERFSPGYYEDLDFCLRMMKENITMLLVPDAKLWHKVSSSSGGEANPSVIYLKARNGAFYMRKYMQWWQAPFIIVYRAGRALWASTKLLYQRNFEGLAALWNGLLVGWLNLGKTNESKYLNKYSSNDKKVI